MTTYYRFNPERSKLAIKRLEKLADFLDTVPKNRFDLGIIARNKKCETGDFILPSDNELIKDIKEGACGTAACAIGWCPSVFPTLFSWVVRREYTGDQCDYAEIAVEHKQSHKTDFDAAEKVFELDDDEAIYLFGTEHYPNEGGTSAKTVAKRIREFIKVGMPEDCVGY